MIRNLIASVILMFIAASANAKTVDELQAELDTKTQELEAQKVINDLLKQRIETLESQLARVDPAQTADGIPAPYSKPPPDTDLGEEQVRALERAFERRGLSVLPPKVIQVTPSLSWSHAGTDLNRDALDVYSGAVDARVGLPWNAMIGAGIAYRVFDRQNNEVEGDLGNLNLNVWKGLVNQTETLPRVVARVGYSLPIDEEDGLHSLSGSILVSKSLDPMSFFGSASYTHFFDRTINGVEEERAGRIGIGAGAGLAITPDISGTLAIDLGFQKEPTVNGQKVPDSSLTTGIISVGAGFVLSRNIFLSLTAGAGITEDSPDLLLGVSLPVRF